MVALGGFVETGKEGTNVGSIWGQDADVSAKAQGGVDDVIVTDNASSFGSLVEGFNNVEEDPNNEEK